MDRNNRRSIFTNHGDNITTVAAPRRSRDRHLSRRPLRRGLGHFVCRSDCFRRRIADDSGEDSARWEWAQAALSEAASVDGNPGRVGWISGEPFQRPLSSEANACSILNVSKCVGSPWWTRFELCCCKRRYLQVPGREAKDGGREPSDAHRCL